MSAPSEAAVWLHSDDYADTLRLLAGLLGRRTDHDQLGYWPEAGGSYVDWDRLVDAPLSSTQVATVRIARGCAAIERAGGLPPVLGELVVAVVQAVSGQAQENELARLRELARDGAWLAWLCRHPDRDDGSAEFGWPEMTPVLDRLLASPEAHDVIT